MWRGPAWDGVAKRTLDICVASLGLVATAPLQAAVAVGVALRLGRPVLFRQQRPGRHGAPFTLIKFRSMRAPDPDAGVNTDAARLTPFGSRIRRLSLDELPTLWNVLRGDMSLVGPRPLLMSYLERYTPEQARRHDVRPGITGLAQVAGRNAMSWNDKLQADTEYVDSRSFALDLKILIKTLIVVVRREGISAANGVTMPEFLGCEAPGQTP